MEAKMDYFGIIIHHDGMDRETLQACADVIFEAIAGFMQAQSVSQAMYEARECIACGECFAWFTMDEAVEAVGQLYERLPPGSKVFVVESPIP
jgi:hypothetical protein